MISFSLMRGTKLFSVSLSSFPSALKLERIIAKQNCLVFRFRRISCYWCRMSVVFSLYFQQFVAVTLFLAMYHVLSH